MASGESGSDESAAGSDVADVPDVSDGSDPKVPDVLSGATPPPGIDPDIERLALGERAKKAAYLLKQKHPDVVFTSGRRDPAAQAHAMATNIVKNRKWVGETYADNPASHACQKWVDDNPKALTVEVIAAGLLALFKALGPVLAHLSSHLSGEAFDVQPTTHNGDAIKATIRGLPGLTKFLENEGGLIRWHAQF